MLPRRQYTRSTAYREFYGDHRLDYIVCLRLNGRPHGTAGMCGLLAGRGADDGDFTAEHKRDLLGVVAVIAALHAAQARQAELRRVLEGVAVAVDGDQALLVLSAAGDLLWSSSPARAVLAAARKEKVDRVLAEARAAVAIMEALARPRRVQAVDLGSAGTWGAGAVAPRRRPVRGPAPAGDRSRGPAGRALSAHPDRS